MFRAQPAAERAFSRIVDHTGTTANAGDEELKSQVRVGDRTKVKKRTSIGHSRLTRFRNKHKRRQAKYNRGQGKALP